jgi:hypothetical protein
MKDVNGDDPGGETGNPAPGFVPMVTKKFIDNKWIGVALVAFVVVLLFILKK